MTYPGAKNGAGVYQTIINQIPPHDIYIEPYLGSGAILRRKRPAPIANIGIDRSPKAIAAFGDASGFRINCGSALDFLKHFKFTGREFVYCDPPYVRSTRRSTKDIYEFEMTDDDHIELLGVLKTLPCMVMISGYPGEEGDLYDYHLSDWRHELFWTRTRGGDAIECIWMNYPEPTALHDYSFLGVNFRQRERIKRKAKRWANRLAALPPLERLAILSEFARFRQ
ncbi:MAG: DNA adenine methylase [Nitrospinaceae bacterium]